MSTANSPIFLYTSLYVFLILLPFMCSFKKGYAIEGYEIADKNFQSHVLKPNSLLSSQTCSQSLRVPEKGSTSKLVHRYGPCINLLNQNQGVAKAPSYSDVIRRDQLRVNSIHARQRAFNLTPFNDMKTTVRTSSGVALGTLNYVVRVGLGNPQKQLTLAFDTGSDITWTQCQPCLVSCYQQSDPIFDPAMSTFYKNISCSSPSCSLKYLPY